MVTSAMVNARVASFTVRALRRRHLSIYDNGVALDIDGNGTDDALTDDLLAMRYLFGLRGTALIQNAIGQGATRTTAADSENYLEWLLQ